jgi:lipid-binding SYLF domain-containing protein
MLSSARKMRFRFLSPLQDSTLAIPTSFLAKASCVAVIPGYKKGGFVVSGSYGAGLVSCRDANGKFSSPEFIAMAGAGFGWQIGADSADVVLLMMGKNEQENILSNSGFKLGAEGGVTAGPIGRNYSADTNLGMREETITYAQSRGIYAGLSLTGAKLWNDSHANDAVESNDELKASVKALQDALNSVVQ